MSIHPQRMFTFTGSRHGKAILFYVGAHALNLQGTQVEVLARLCIARFDHEEGYALATALDICRLRKKLDTVRPGLGMELIETGDGQEYRLTPPRDELASAVVLTHCFFQLVERKHITQVQADTLRTLFPVMSHAEVKEQIKARKVKSKRNRKEIG